MRSGPRLPRKDSSERVERALRGTHRCVWVPFPTRVGGLRRGQRPRGAAGDAEGHRADGIHAAVHGRLLRRCQLGGVGDEEAHAALGGHAPLGCGAEALRGEHEAQAVSGPEAVLDGLERHLEGMHGAGRENYGQAVVRPRLPVLSANADASGKHGFQRRALTHPRGRGQRQCAGVGRAEEAHLAVAAVELCRPLDDLRTIEPVAARELLQHASRLARPARMHLRHDVAVLHEIRVPQALVALPLVGRELHQYGERPRTALARHRVRGPGHPRLQANAVIDDVDEKIVGKLVPVLRLSRLPSLPAWADGPAGASCVISVLGIHVRKRLIAKDNAEKDAVSLSQGLEDGGRSRGAIPAWRASPPVRPLASAGSTSVSKHFEVTVCDLKAAERSIHLLAKRGDNRADDGGILKSGKGKALLTGILQGRSHQVALGAVQDEEAVVE